MRNTTFEEYIKLYLKANNWKEVNQLYASQTAHQYNLSFSIDADVTTYTSKSDSVQLLHNCKENKWHIEVFPVDASKNIRTFTFLNEQDAMEAFTMWTHYMNVVVYEQFKNF